MFGPLAYGLRVVGLKIFRATTERGTLVLMPAAAQAGVTLLTLLPSKYGHISPFCLASDVATSACVFAYTSGALISTAGNSKFSWGC